VPFTDAEIKKMRESGVMVRVELDTLFLLAEWLLEMNDHLHDTECAKHTARGKAQCVGYELCIRLIAHTISIGVSEMVESN